MQKNAMHIDSTETPLAESNVSLRLAEIQARCRELLDDDTSIELSLEEPGRPNDRFNPYDRG